MWFKNLIIYRFTKKFQPIIEELETLMNKKTFQKCSNQEVSSYGWIPPLGKEHQSLTHCHQNFIMLCAQKEEKILPSSVVNEYLKDRVTQIEEEQNRQVYNKEKKTLKEDIIIELLPRAFTKRQTLYAYIDIDAGWFAVDTASFNKAEELTSLLRETLGSLPIRNVNLKQSPGHTITQWLQDPTLIPKPFILGQDCELKEKNNNGGKINIKNQDLHTSELQAHLNADMQVSKLALTWNDLQSFVLSDTLILQRLKYTDVIEEKLDAIEAQTHAEQFDADFALMTLSNKELITDLISALGDEISTK